MQMVFRYLVPAAVLNSHSVALGRLQAFRMYGGIGMSASSLHRESTDSPIVQNRMDTESSCTLAEANSVQRCFKTI